MRAFPPPIAEPRCRVPKAHYHDRRALGVGCRHRGYRDYARDPSVRVHMCAGLIVCLAINPAIAYTARGETSAVARAEREAEDSTPSTACHRRSTLRRRIHTPQGPPRPAVARRGSTRLVGVKPEDFWAEVDALATEHQADKGRAVQVCSGQRTYRTLARYDLRRTQRAPIGGRLEAIRSRDPRSLPPVPRSPPLAGLSLGRRARVSALAVSTR